jgi:hypothetical protein
MPSITRAEERYIHLASSSHDLNFAWRVLRELKEASGSSLAGPAFQFALIAYARPYMPSRGTAKREHRLSPRYVPPEHRDLHGRLLAARNTILAHSDLTVKQARLHVANTATGKYVGVVQNVIYGTEEWGNLDQIIDLIQKTLDVLYGDIAALERDLPANA